MGKCMLIGRLQKNPPSPSSRKHPEGQKEDGMLGSFLEYLNSCQILQELSHAMNRSIDGPFKGLLAWAKRSSQVMPHTDQHIDDDGRRDIAFVLHMAKDWKKEYGGEFVWFRPKQMIAPSFNSLTIFPVHETSYHYISPVSRHVPKHVKRLTLAGWWYSRSKGWGSELGDLLRKRPFSYDDPAGLYVNGRDGSLLAPSWKSMYATSPRKTFNYDLFSDFLENT